MRHMHHVKGKYGYKYGIGDSPENYRTFPVSFAYSKDSSVTEEILLWWLKEHLTSLYPYVKDVPGKRVLLKGDCGPGRLSEKFRVIARSYGVYFFPGVPNGTEFLQELDQLFALLKTKMEENRDALWRLRFNCIENQDDKMKANVDVWDLPVIVFGGRVFGTGGREKLLKNAFNEGFDEIHIESALKKCGYCPPTRILLESPILRHEVLEGEESNETLLLKQMEKENHEVVNELVKLGYVLAKNLERKLKIVTKEQQRARACTTVPNTKDRQEKLINITTAGAWFNATGGGACLNCDDALIAFEMKRRNEKKNELVKMKKALNSREKQIKQAREVMKAKGEHYNAKDKKNKNGKYVANWNQSDLKAMIRWKDPKASFKDINGDKYVELWNKVKDNKDSADRICWTERDEELLKNLESESGIYSIYQTHIMRKAEKQKKEQLLIKVNALTDRSKMNLLRCLFNELTDEQRDGLLDTYHDCTLSDDDSLSTVDGFVDFNAATDDTDNNDGPGMIEDLASEGLESNNDTDNNNGRGMIVDIASEGLESNNERIDGTDEWPEDYGAQGQFDAEQSDDKSHVSKVGNIESEDTRENVYNDMDIEELIVECKKKSIRCTSRYKKKTLIKKLLESRE